jgi:hypothetical protein
MKSCIDVAFLVNSRAEPPGSSDHTTAALTEDRGASCRRCDVQMTL